MAWMNRAAAPRPVRPLAPPQAARSSKTPRTHHAATIAGELTGFLTQRTRRGVDLVDDITRRASALADLGLLRVIERADPALAALISHDRTLRGLCRPLRNLHLAVAPEQETNSAPRSANSATSFPHDADQFDRQRRDLRGSGKPRLV